MGVHDSVWDVTQFLKEKEKDGLSPPSSTAYSTSFQKKAFKKKIENQLVQSNIHIAHTYHKLLVTKLIVIVEPVKTLLVIHMSSL